MLQVKDTQEYKDLVQLHQLHDSYQKHTKGVGTSYNNGICPGCGMPYTEYSGETCTTKEAVKEMFVCYSYRNNRSFLEIMPDAVYAYSLELLCAEGIPADDDEGVWENGQRVVKPPNFSTPGWMINHKMQLLKGRIDLTKYRELMLKSDDVSPKDLYLYARNIECAPSADIYARLLAILDNDGSRRWKRSSNALVLLAWHYHFKTKPSSDLFKKVSTWFTDHDLRPLWARVAGVTLAVSYRWKYTKGAIHAYYLVRDTLPKKYNDIEFMHKHFGKNDCAMLLYYQHTGRLVGELTNITAAIKSRLIDKAPEPSATDKVAMGKLYDWFYGDRAAKLSLIDYVGTSEHRLGLCNTLEEYLMHEENFRESDLTNFRYGEDLTRGFGLDDDEELEEHREHAYKAWPQTRPVAVAIDSNPAAVTTQPQ